MSRRFEDDPDDAPIPDEPGDEAPNPPTVRPAAVPDFRAASVDALDDLARIDSFLEGHDSSGAYVTIHRRAPGQVKFAFCAKVPLEQFSDDAVRQTYGGGSYQVKLYTATRKIVRTFEYDVDERIRGELDKRDVPAPAPAAPAGSGDRDLLLAMLASQREDAQRNLQFMVTMMGESQKAQAAMITALLGRGNAEPASVLVQSAVDLARVARQSAPDPMGGASGVLNLIREVRSVFGGNGAAPADDGGDRETAGDKFLGPLLQAAGPILSALMQRGQPQTMMVPQVAVPMPPAPAPVPMPAAPVVPAGPPQAQAPAPAVPAMGAEAFLAALPPRARELVAQVRGLYPVVASMARTDTPVESVVDVMAGTLTEEDEAILAMVLGRADWKLVLFGDPDPQPAGWFDNLRSVILEPPADEPAPAPLVDVVPGNAMPA